jgi:hypothetical protein
MTTVSKNHLLATTLRNNSEFLQEKHKAHYSHGLEAIYALETIDIKTVRPMLVGAAQKEEKSLTHTEEEESEIQLTLDLGPFFRDWIPPYILSEPIQVIDLGKQIEKLLIERGVLTLGDLQKFHEKNALLKGFGQGHREDVRSKLSDYLGNRPQRAKTIDFLSLLKCLYGGLDRRKAFVALEPYELESWIALTPLEKMEIKRLQQSERQEWIDELAYVKESPWLKREWELLVETFLKPWMMKRGGYATNQQLEEVCLLRSQDAKFAYNAMLLLQPCLSFDSYLPAFDNLLAATCELHSLGKEMIACALSYFTHPSSFYSLEGLCLLIHAEFAQKWKNAAPKTLETLLRLNSRFHTYRGRDGEWFISRAPLVLC